MIATAKLFKNGSSQAVRLPKEFRFEGDKVCIKRLGSAVLLFSKDSAMRLMEEAIENIDPDFMAERNKPMEFEKRKSLDVPRRKRA